MCQNWKSLQAKFAYSWNNNPTKQSPLFIWYKWFVFAPTCFKLLYLCSLQGRRIVLLGHLCGKGRCKGSKIFVTWKFSNNFQQNFVYNFFDRTIIMFWVNLPREFSMATNHIILQMDASIYPVRSNRSDLRKHIRWWHSMTGPGRVNRPLSFLHGNCVPYIRSKAKETMLSKFRMTQQKCFKIITLIFVVLTVSVYSRVRICYTFSV